MLPFHPLGVRPPEYWSFSLKLQAQRNPFASKMFAPIEPRRRYARLHTLPPLGYPLFLDLPVDPSEMAEVRRSVGVDQERYAIARPVAPP